MGGTSKSLALVLTLIVVISTLILFSSMHFGLAQSGTNVSGIISQDTTWTKANSPINFIGDVTVENGVTLTIEAGVQVEFTQHVPATDQYGRSYDKQIPHNLQVDGTIIATGSFFNDGQTITFSQYSTDSIIQNTNFNGYFQINLVNSSTKFYFDSFISGNTNRLGANTFTISGGAPIINGCNFDGIDASSESIITVNDGSAVISNNTVNDNTVASDFVSLYGANNAIVSNNHISGNFGQSAVTVSSGNPLIERNFISNPNTVIYGYPAIGLTINGDATPLIENNTIAMNKVGLNIYDSASPTITNNNFEQNSQYNIYLGEQGVYGSTTGNIIAINNWWGTSDPSVINQTIYDHKNNYNVGTVTTVPILNSPNPDALPNPNATTSTPTPTSSPTSTLITPSTQSPTPTVPELSWLAVIPLIVGVLSIAVIIRHRKTANLKQ